MDCNWRGKHVQFIVLLKKENETVLPWGKYVLNKKAIIMNVRKTK